jgi:hypothetical protein
VNDSNTVISTDTDTGTAQVHPPGAPAVPSANPATLLSTDDYMRERDRGAARAEGATEVHMRELPKFLGMLKLAIAETASERASADGPSFRMSDEEREEILNERRERRRYENEQRVLELAQNLYIVSVHRRGLQCTVSDKESVPSVEEACEMKLALKAARLFVKLADEEQADDSTDDAKRRSVEDQAAQLEGAASGAPTTDGAGA